jgi:hypothetical protein
MVGSPKEHVSEVGCKEGLDQENQKWCCPKASVRVGDDLGTLETHPLQIGRHSMRVAMIGPRGGGGIATHVSFS